MEVPTVEVFFPIGQHLRDPAGAVEQTVTGDETVWTRRAHPLPHYVVPDPPPGTRVVLGIGDRAVVRLVLPARQNEVEALRAVERRMSPAPAVVGALLAAAVGLKYRPRLTGGEGPAHIARACALADAPGTSTLSSDQVRRLAEEALQEWLIADRPLQAAMPAGAVDRARYWLAVAGLLWRTDVLRSVGQLGRRWASRVQEMTWVATLAGAHVMLHTETRAVRLPGGVVARLESGEMIPRALAWPQAVELAAGEIPAAALRWLTGGRLDLEAPPTLDRPGSAGMPPVPDPQLCMALARQFIAEATEQGVYAPEGAFEVEIPAALPLATWGVRRLRVWCTPQGFWVGVVGETGEVGCVFEWRPAEGIRPWTVAPVAIPMVHATLAALWHDLRVAGEEALPAAGGRPSRPVRREGEGGAPAARPAGRRPRRLPGRRLVLTGRRTWGRPEERARMARQAHTVRGHLRRLPAGWQPSPQAREAAGAFGLTLPPGYTFVRPHVRGGHGEEAEPVVVHARGLLTLTAMLGH